MALTFVPCADGHTHEDISDCVSLVQQDHEQNQSPNESDLCSPFCFCTCCQSVSHPEFTTLAKVNFVALDIFLPFIENNIANQVIPFWRPPKI
ncbi:hypothetical protein OM075_21735 [Marinilabiliaceae bacterium AAT]|uniref:Uncharacterized protein n=2 Tax=Plebeiibacterium sediminum TaxID=2992112 RepID=A0AAE3SH27_9BACT|nr:DUF6660 family protein [Plebeiobacterium sediminum]MCW3789103.1 hypothetical protein [Plebeiobacterium sediminum]